MVGVLATFILFLRCSIFLRCFSKEILQCKKQGFHYAQCVFLLAFLLLVKRNPVLKLDLTIANWEIPKHIKYPRASPGSQRDTETHGSPPQPPGTHEGDGKTFAQFTPHKFLSKELETSEVNQTGRENTFLSVSSEGKEPAAFGVRH